MDATVDAAGRIVVPKQPASVPMRLVRRGKTVAVEPDQPLPTLTAEEVRTILESGRR
jgi:hypothetical protein